MKAVRYEDYSKALKEFFEEHGVIRTDAGTLDEYGTYHKEFIGEDGEVFYEVNRIEYLQVKCMYDGIAIGHKLTEVNTCEFWTSTGEYGTRYYREVIK